MCGAGGSLRRSELLRDHNTNGRTEVDTMGRRYIPEATKAEARRLRTTERLGLDAIAARTGISKGTLSTLLRDVPLQEDELTTRMRTAAKVTTAKRVRVYPTVVLPEMRPTRGERARTARARVVARLEAMGCRVEPDRTTPPEEGRLTPRSGLWVRTPDGRALRVRVCTTFREKLGTALVGRPCVRTGDPARRAGPGDRPPLPMRRWTRADADAVVGFDPDTERMFVVSLGEVPADARRHRCGDTDEEAWHRLGLPVRDLTTDDAPASVDRERTARARGTQPAHVARRVRTRAGHSG